MLDAGALVLSVGTTSTVERIGSVMVDEFGEGTGRREKG
jgi:hypothetical protein